jgi:hypothetical protein
VWVRSPQWCRLRPVHTARLVPRVAMSGSDGFVRIDAVGRESTQTPDGPRPGSAGLAGGGAASPAPFSPSPDVVGFGSAPQAGQAMKVSDWAQFKLLLWKNWIRSVQAHCEKFEIPRARGFGLPRCWQEVVVASASDCAWASLSRAVPGCSSSGSSELSEDDEADATSYCSVILNLVRCIAPLFRQEKACNRRDRF